MPDPKPMGRIVTMPRPVDHSPEPQPPTGKGRLRNQTAVLDCVAEDMAHRFLSGTQFSTIRNKLHGNRRLAEDAIRRGILLRLARRERAA